MSHHVPGPPDYDVVMTEQVPGPKEPKLLGRHMPSIPNRSGAGWERAVWLQLTAARDQNRNIHTVFVIFDSSQWGL